MSAVVSRPPLQEIGMSAPQRLKRKGTRYAFDDDDVQPPDAKRNKVEASTKQANGTANGASTQRKKKNYEQEVDGFKFNIKKSKAPVLEQAAPEPPKQRRKKNSFTPTPTSDSPAPPKRRSARLSGDKTQVAVELPLPVGHRTNKSKRAASPRPAESGRDASPQLPAAELYVEKKRDGTKIALHFQDTPMAARNKEMRAAKTRNSTSSRRSSTQSRGRRASNLIESGTSNAVPHSDVEIRDFYKHIEDGLPEPKRMRQLLTWCGTRVLPEKAKGTGNMNEDLAVDAAWHINAELLKDFASKGEMSDWFNREDDAGASALIKRPNPRNIQNAAKIQELEQEIQRLEKEQLAWKTLLKPTKSKPANQPQQTLQPIDSSLLNPTQASLLAYLDTSQPAASSSSSSSRIKSKLSAEVSSRIESLTSNLEPTVNAFADGIHCISQYNDSAARIADRVKSIMAQRLEKRSEEARMHGGNGEVGGRDVLRALAGKLNEK